MCVLLQVVGAVGLELWVESSGADVDVFAYLEDIDMKGVIRWSALLFWVQGGGGVSTGVRYRGVVGGER